MTRRVTGVSRWIGALLCVSCASGAQVAESTTTPAESAEEEECFGVPDDNCRDICFPRDRQFECLAHDVTGACVVECAGRDEMGECYSGIDCDQWEGPEGEAGRCLRRMPIGCAPLP
jgi:hypothetical protein